MLKIQIIILLFGWHAQALPASGKIKGSLDYPGEGVPTLKVCAETISLEKKRICINTEINAATFQIVVPPGKYFVFASLVEKRDAISTDYRAYWSEFVKCGSKATCKVHSPIKIEVKSGETVTGIDPQDWYL